MSDRLKCVVPFCRRTRKKNGHSEWICSVHWPMVSQRTRRRKVENSRFIRRELRRNPMASEYWRMKPGSPERLKAVAMWKVSDSIWLKCKQEAIEVAAGITGRK